MLKIAAWAVVAWGLLMGSAIAANVPGFPMRPIRFINPFPAGGSSDILARMLAAKVSESTGQSVVVDSRPGAGGNIGMELAAKAAPDGHTWVLGYVGTLAINPALYGKVPYDPVKDFEPVSLLTASQLVLVVHPSLTPGTVPEFIKLAKGTSRLNYASGGSGTGPHLAAELFKTTAGVDLQHIPYKGSAPAMTDLLAGRVPIAFMPVLTALPHINAGRLRGLGVTGPQRAKAAPQIPAIAESLPGFDVRTWFGLLLPARTPPPLVAAVHAETVKALNLPDVQDRLTSQGFEIVAGTPSDFGSYIRTESEKWARVIRISGARPD
jgi:tripartite-type tricarboxylate transporter receptor subunit TctC